MSNKVTIKNQVLVNPESGRPFVFRDQKLDDDGNPILRDESHLSPDGKTIFIKVPVLTDPLPSDLFETILRCLREVGGKDLTTGAIESYFQVSSAIRKARRMQPNVNEQWVKVDSKTLAWMKEELQARLLTFSRNREFVGVVLASLGMIVEDEETED